MASDIIAALSRFSETLADKTVDGRSKLKVLHTLNEVTLTLSELSSSGVSRAVRHLKVEPGELGEAARNLVIKWKSLLDEHMRRENIVLQPSPKKKFSHQSVEKSATHSNSNDGTKVEKIDMKSKSCTPSDKQNYIPSKDKEVKLYDFIPPPLKAKKRSKPIDSSKSKQNSSHEKMEIQSEELNSIDSSSGLSFEQSLFMIASGSPNTSKKPSTKRKKPKSSHIIPPQKFDISPQQSKAFSTEILTSLSDIVDPSDMRIQHRIAPTSSHSCIGEDDDDGDLKFKSKKVLWAPRVKKILRTHEDGDGAVDCILSDPHSSPPSLIDLCLNVIERNITYVEHVGLLPYELFSGILAKISATELSRIESHNPQYEGLTDELWQRHVQRDFPENKNSPPRCNESWFQLYKRLEADRTKRLNRFINKSTTKLIAEKEMRRTTLTTDVITPARIRRRANRELNSNPPRSSGAIFVRNNNPVKKHHGPGLVNFQPRNMSGPAPTSNPASRINSLGGGNSLDALRKSFLGGR